MIDAVEVWTNAQGVPKRLVWRAHRYRIEGEPVRFSDLFQPTHPLPFDGWRVTAVNELGWGYQFDLRLDAAGGRWSLIGVGAQAEAGYEHRRSA